MDQDNTAFLGRGWSFPPSFDRINNSIQMVAGLADIEESIRIILSTTPGERIMQPKFGCPLNDFVFEQASTNLLTEINHVVGRALLDYEPRIRFHQAELLQEAGTATIRIRVSYSVISTNSRHNIVFPFYLAEGTSVSM